MGNQAYRPTRLILVKHGRPQIEPDRPRSSWGLSEEGRIDALRLAEKLVDHAPARLVSSAEPKAVQTARIMAERLGLVPQIEPGFGEQRADESPFGSQAQFEADVARLFASPDSLTMGEETGAAARFRFGAALACLEAGGASVVVAHGRIITLWLSHRLGFEAMPFWKTFGLCHAVVLEGDRFEMIAP